MSRMVSRAVLALTVLAALGACTSKGTGPAPDGASTAAGSGGSGTAGTGMGGAGGSAGSGGAGGSVMDASPASTIPRDCRGLRNCVHACGTDPTCAMRCVSTAPAADQALYRMIRTCSMQWCPAQDQSCRCEHECYGGGQCATLVEQCNLADPDTFCDPRGGPCGL